MIRDLIVQTPYLPGERLPPEREIAEMLNVTRTVVREALIMLEIKGLVDVRRSWDLRTRQCRCADHRQYGCQSLQ